MKQLGILLILLSFSLLATENVSLKFLGGAKLVAGSAYLVKTPASTFLVDYGARKGENEEMGETPDSDKYNLTEIPLNSELFDIDFIILTHAHGDHIGLIPKIFKFQTKYENELKKAGRYKDIVIFTSEGTADLAGPTLEDSVKVQQKQALPVYTLSDVKKTLKQTIPIKMFTNFFPLILRKQFLGLNKSLNSDSNLEISFYPTGHIVGSAMAYITLKNIPYIQNKNLNLLFTGDVGNFDASDEKNAVQLYGSPTFPLREKNLCSQYSENPVCGKKEILFDPDYILIDSTNGDIKEESYITPSQIREKLKKYISAYQRNIDKPGKILIPTLSFGRLDKILWELKNIKNEENSIIGDNWDVIYTSALGQGSLNTSLRFPENFHPEVQRLIKKYWLNFNSLELINTTLKTEFEKEVEKLNTTGKPIKISFGDVYKTVLNSVIPDRLKKGWKNDLIFSKMNESMKIYLEQVKAGNPVDKLEIEEPDTDSIIREPVISIFLEVFSVIEKLKESALHTINNYPSKLDPSKIGKSGAWLEEDIYKNFTKDELRLATILVNNVNHEYFGQNEGLFNEKELRILRRNQLIYNPFYSRNSLKNVILDLINIKYNPYKFFGCDNMKSAGSYINDDLKRMVNDQKKGKKGIIISTNGMLAGGSILEYLKAYGTDINSKMIFINFQAYQTNGYKILNALKQTNPISIDLNPDITPVYINFEGQKIPVSTQVAQLSGFSGHWSQKGIIKWLASFNFSKRLKKVLLVHGEIPTLETLKKDLDAKKKTMKLQNTEFFIPSENEILDLK